jgi:hypothetical protein
MSQYPISFLIGNPALEAMELQDVGAADLTPTLDDDAFAGDELTDREIDELYVAEMARRDAAAADGDDDPTPPAGGGMALPRETADYWQDVAVGMADAVLIDAIDLANVEPHRVNVGGAERTACLDGFTRELLRRMATQQRAAA